MQVLKIKQLRTTEFEAFAPSQLNPGEVHVYCISVEVNSTKLKFLEGILSAGELAKARSYHQKKDMQRSIVSRGIQRIILGGYLYINPADLVFSPGTYKKPELVGDASGLQYNISHSADFILLAISGTPVGADIEKINTDFDFREVLAGNFNIEEIAYINAEDSAHRFFRLWTRKEAFLKGTGRGLTVQLDEIPSLEGTHHLKTIHGQYTVFSFNLGADYSASIACCEPKPILRFINMTTYP